MLPSSSQSEKKKNTEIILKMEATSSFETSVTYYRWTRRRVPEEGDPDGKALKNPNQVFLSLYSIVWCFRLWQKTYVSLTCYFRKSNNVLFQILAVF